MERRGGLDGWMDESVEPRAASAPQDSDIEEISFFFLLSLFFHGGPPSKRRKLKDVETKKKRKENFDFPFLKWIYER